MGKKKTWTVNAVIKADIQRYIGCNKFNIWKVIKACYNKECLFYVILFRLFQKVIQLKNPFLRIFLKIFFVWTTYKFLSIFLGIHIDGRAKIGKGFYIGHYGGIFIGPVEIGKYCNISQQVTIGYGGQGTKRYGLPKIGDYVYIGPGAKIFSNIIIGNNVSIGANAVVSKNIPDNAIVVGNPGRIVGYQKKNPLIHNVCNS